MQHLLVESQIYDTKKQSQKPAHFSSVTGVAARSVVAAVARAVAPALAAYGFSWAIGRLRWIFQTKCLASNLDLGVPGLTAASASKRLLQAL